MKVSIIIPIFNVKDYVEACLKSVWSQTYTNLEIILINDQTQDISMDIIERFIQKYPTSFEVNIIQHDKNYGLSEARNTGIKYSTGEYLYFLDSDDEISEDCIESLVKGAHGADMVVGDYQVLNTELPFPLLYLPTCTLKDFKSLRKAFMGSQIYQMAWNKLVRRDFIISHDLYFKPGLIHEDCLWHFMCGCKIESLSIVKQTTYFYKVRKNSIMTDIGFERDFHSYLTIMREMYNYVKQEKLLQDKYVFSYIEEQRFYLLYAYCSKNLFTDNLRQEFLHITDLQPYNRIRIFLWGRCNKRNWIRDAHFFIANPAYRADYLFKSPHYVWAFENTKFRKSFYNWFWKSISLYLLRVRKPVVFRPKYV